MLAIFIISMGVAWAIPTINLSVQDDPGTTPGEVAETVEILFILTLIGLAPSILILMTASRGSSSFLASSPSPRSTNHASGPTARWHYLVFDQLHHVAHLRRVYQEAMPIATTRAPTRTSSAGPQAIRDFMFQQTRKRDLQTMLDLGNVENAQWRMTFDSGFDPRLVTSELTPPSRSVFTFTCPSSSSIWWSPPS